MKPDEQHAIGWLLSLESGGFVLNSDTLENLQSAFRTLDDKLYESKKELALYYGLRQELKNILLNIGRGNKSYGISGEVFIQSFSVKQMNDLWNRYFEIKE